MKELEISVLNVGQLPAVAKSIIQYSDAKVFAFYGPMGSGKTTLIKELCRQLGSHDNFSSPTYSIVNEYLIEGTSQKIYHMDLYRVKDLEEALALGIEEYTDGQSYCFVEWPELIENVLPRESVIVQIKPVDNMREITIFSR